MPNVRFVGGPCDGRTQFFYDPPVVGFIVPCGNRDYAYSADGTLRDVGPIGSGGFLTGGPVARRGHKGWSDLQRAVNRSIPTTLARSKRVRRAAQLRLARKRRLV